MTVDLEFFASSHIAHILPAEAACSNNRLSQPLVSTKEIGEEAMAENKQDPLDVPMDQVLTRDSGSDPKGSVPKVETGQTASAETKKIEGSHTQETVDPAERLPEELEEQNDLA